LSEGGHAFVRPSTSAPFALLWPFNQLGFEQSGQQMLRSPHNFRIICEFPLNLFHGVFRVRLPDQAVVVPAQVQKHEGNSLSGVFTEVKRLFLAAFLHFEPKNDKSGWQEANRSWHCKHKYLLF
jgi:hypothetical protein